MGVGAEDIARACLTAYASLGKRGKPGIRSNGQPEWTILAGFVLVVDNDGQQGQGATINVVSLGCALCAILNI